MEPKWKQYVLNLEYDCCKVLFQPISLHGWWNFYLLNSKYKLKFRSKVWLWIKVAKLRSSFWLLIDETLDINKVCVLCSIQYNSKTTACGGIMLLSHASYSPRPEAVASVCLCHCASGGARPEFLSWLSKIEHSKVASSM